MESILSQARVSAALPPVKHKSTATKTVDGAPRTPQNLVFNKSPHSCRSRRQHQSSTCALFFVSFFPPSLACFCFAPYFCLRVRPRKLPIPPQPRNLRSPPRLTIPPSPCASTPSASLISTNSAPPTPRSFLSKLCRPIQNFQWLASISASPSSTHKKPKPQATNS